MSVLVGDNERFLVRLNTHCRDWGWELVLALEKHCRNQFGYSGIKNVNQVDINITIRNQSILVF